MTHRNTLHFLSLLLALTVACFKFDEVDVLEGPSDSSNSRNGNGGKARTGSGSESGLNPTAGTDADPFLPGPAGGAWFADELCKQGGYCAPIEPFVPALDLLFVVDNSHSMAEPQVRMREQFLRLIQALAQGWSSYRGTEFWPVESLHLGVVSTDMGAGMANTYPGCDAGGGDDALLQHPGGAFMGCEENYPAFLTYEGDAGATADDLACIATLGTGGCGVEQPLEAALKALWPVDYIDENGSAIPPAKNPIQFGATSKGRFSHGDVPIAEGGNGGFLQGSPAKPALLAVVVVTDGDDCSVRDASFLAGTTDDDTTPGTPVDLLCQENQSKLFEVQRYVAGFAALYPGRADKVMFGAIAGVPTDLVDTQARAGVNFADPASRDAYYDRILRDDRMQYRSEEKDGSALPVPSCVAATRSGQANYAFPPRRLIEAAKGFGGNGFVQSLCSDDLFPAFDVLTETLAARLYPPCLTEALLRDGDGKVDCKLVWQLPHPDRAAAGTPTSCGDAEFLAPAGSKYPEKNAAGGVNCAMKQLPVVREGLVPTGSGFFYDDFSVQAVSCLRDGQRNITFSADARPPADVEVFLDCAEGSTAP